jgi:hypothetical protein
VRPAWQRNACHESGNGDGLEALGYPPAARARCDDRRRVEHRESSRDHNRQVAEYAAFEGRESPKPMDVPTTPLTSCPKENTESRSDAEADEGAQDVHGRLILYTGAAVVSTMVVDIGRFCSCAEYCFSRIEKADRAAGSRAIPAMVNGRV